MYAFKSKSGSPCVVLTGQTGFCAQSASDGTPGLQWSIGGGTPKLPSTLVGIASDDVASVGLDVDGANVPVTLANNVAFAEFPADSQHATITITRADGANTVDINLAG